MDCTEIYSSHVALSFNRTKALAYGNQQFRKLSHSPLEAQAYRIYEVGNDDHEAERHEHNPHDHGERYELCGV